MKIYKIIDSDKNHPLIRGITQYELLAQTIISMFPEQDLHVEEFETIENEELIKSLKDI